MSNELMIIPEAQPVALVKVVDEITREQSANRIILLKKGKAAVVAFWEKKKKMADQLHKMIRKDESDMLDVYDVAIAEQSTEEKIYLREEERKRKEAREKEEAEARKKAEEEQDRIAAEQEKAISEGDIEKAIELEDKPLPPIAPAPAPVRPLPQKTIRTDAGTASATKDTFVEVTDIKAFFKYCAENDLSELWGDVKLGAVRTMVKNKGLKEVPGLDIYEDFVLQHRAAR